MDKKLSYCKEIISYFTFMTVLMSIQLFKYDLFNWQDNAMNPYTCEGLFVWISKTHCFISWQNDL